MAERVHWVCQAKDFIGLQLCGEVCSDATSFAGVVHAFSRDVDPAFLGDLGLRPTQLPRWTLPFRNAGYSTREAQDSLGLRIGVPIVTGSVDTVCRMIGTGALRDEAAVLCGGDPVILGLQTSAVPSPASRLRVLPFHGNGIFAYRDVTDAAVTLDWAHAIESLSRNTGKSVRELVVSGDGFAGGEWCQLLADVVELQVVVAEEPDAAVLGAAMLAAVGYGQFETVAQASEQMVRLSRRIDPASQADRVKGNP